MIAQHFSSIPPSLCHMEGAETGLMVAQVPTASAEQSTRALPLQLACRPVVTTWLTRSRRLHSATAVLVNETVWGNVSGYWTQSSVLGLGMAQLTLP